MIPTTIKIEPLSWVLINLSGSLLPVKLYSTPLKIGKLNFGFCVEFFPHARKES